MRWVIYLLILIKYCIAIECSWEGGVRQAEVHTAEPFVPEPSISEVQVDIGNLKWYKSPGVDHIPEELIQAEKETLHSEFYKLIKLI
jgi:hypothetical protein